MWPDFLTCGKKLNHANIIGYRPLGDFIGTLLATRPHSYRVVSSCVANLITVSDCRLNA
jgi:hypothetical protein